MGKAGYPWMSRFLHGKSLLAKLFGPQLFAETLSQKEAGDRLAQQSLSPLLNDCSADKMSIVRVQAIADRKLPGPRPRSSGGTSVFFSIGSKTLRYRNGARRDSSSLRLGSLLHHWI
jgi:hypothetical protein